MCIISVTYEPIIQFSNR